MITTAVRRNMTAAESLSSSISSHSAKTAVWCAGGWISSGWPGCGKRWIGRFQRVGASGRYFPTDRARSARIVMPTLPDAGGLRRRAPRGAEEGTGQDWPSAARNRRPPVSGRCSRSAAVLGSWSVPAPVAARAAGELRLADGGPGLGDRRGHRVAGYRPEQHRAGGVGASCGVVLPLMPRMRRIFGVADQAGLGPFPPVPRPGGEEDVVARPSRRRAGEPWAPAGDSGTLGLSQRSSRR
jgi:hypothetical protein